MKIYHKKNFKLGLWSLLLAALLLAAGLWRGNFDWKDGVLCALLAFLGGLDAVRCAVLCLCFSGMMSAELLNTAIERLCDRQVVGYDKLVREAKDIAAAGVVVCAGFCVAVGALFFLWEGALWTAARFFLERMWAALLLALSIPAALWFAFRFRA